MHSIQLCACALLASCTAIPLPKSTGDISTASMTADWSIFDLGPGDRVHLSVYGQADFTSPEAGIRVAPDGSLSVPLLGAIPVEGKSTEELRSTIEAGLRTYFLEPSVTVWVVEYTSRRFHLLGEVEQSGPFVMDRPITALEALTMGKGLRPGANREKVVILRRHSDEKLEVIAFNARIPGPDGFVQVLPEDVIFVSKSGVGRFSEGFLPYLQGIGFTFSQATSAALAVRTF